MNSKVQLPDIYSPISEAPAAYAKETEVGSNCDPSQPPTILGMKERFEMFKTLFLSCLELSG